MEAEQIASWQPCPFGDFLDFMAGQNAAEWVWPIVETCARHGVLHSEPGCCILARPVDSSIDIDVLNGLGDLLPESGLTPTPDAWHIIYASGGIHGFFRLAPYPLPKLIWQRNGTGPAKIYNFNKVKDRIHGIILAKNPQATA
jgi:hypothetical protein